MPEPTLEKMINSIFEHTLPALIKLGYTSYLGDKIITTPDRESPRTIKEILHSVTINGRVIGGTEEIQSCLPKGFYCFYAHSPFHNLYKLSWNSRNLFWGYTGFHSWQIGYVNYRVRKWHMQINTIELPELYEYVRPKEIIDLLSITVSEFSRQLLDVAHTAATIAREVERDGWELSKYLPRLIPDPPSERK